MACRPRLLPRRRGKAVLGELRRRRAAKRVNPGDGRPLKRFRWWQQFSRSLFYLELLGSDGRRTVYAVDVRPMGDEDGRVLANLYRDGWHHATSKVRSEEHTSELQSRQYLVCRLLLEKKNTLLN